MIRRTLIVLAGALFCFGPATAQDMAASALPRVVLETSAGPIVVEVATTKAPVTAANFLRYIDEKRLDGTTFYRAMSYGSAMGLVQGGTNNDPARTLPPIEHEPTTQTGLSHIDGAISMARYDAGTATGDFFISVGATPSYDAGRPFSIDAHGFAVFGRVVEGMDVVRMILAAPTSPTEGEGFMRGQMLAPKIEIVAARRTQDASVRPAPGSPVPPEPSGAPSGTPAPSSWP